MDCRMRNLPTKRIFGRDITNNQPRRAKINSISEKTTSTVETRLKSRSFDKKITVEHRDAIVEYQEEILAFMLSLQKKEKKEIMTQISSDMRHILVDWLIEVHLSFQLREQTLYLALNYLNQFCSVSEVNKAEYQLVGIACLWIASKYEEIYPPRMESFIKVTDSSYSVAELKAMEGRIILALKFNLNYTTPLQILEAIAEKWPKETSGKLTRESNRALCLCKFFIELSLFDDLGKSYCMKTLVLSALMLVDSVLRTKSQSKGLEEGPIEKETLMKCFKDMCTSFQNISRPNIKLRAIKKKYGDEKYMGVSRFRIEHR